MATQARCIQGNEVVSIKTQGRLVCLEIYIWVVTILTEVVLPHGESVEDSAVSCGAGFLLWVASQPSPQTTFSFLTLLWAAGGRWVWRIKPYRWRSLNSFWRGSGKGSILLVVLYN